jgi:hypothetical protein
MANDISNVITNSATNAATNAIGFQVQKMVDMCANGLLDILFNPSKEEKMKENEEHYSRLMNIVEQHKIPPQREYVSPREAVERDIRESNAHIKSAITELEKAKEKSKCGVCKNTLDDTINLVSEKTGEILNTSEKLLALQKLKETGEIPPQVTWFELNRKQKKLVEETAKLYTQLTAPPTEERGKSIVRRIDDKRKKPQTTKPHRTQKKPSSRKQKAK